MDGTLNITASCLMVASSSFAVPKKTGTTVIGDCLLVQESHFGSRESKRLTDIETEERQTFFPTKGSFIFHRHLVNRRCVCSTRKRLSVMRDTFGRTIPRTIGDDVLRIIQAAKNN